MSSNSFVAWSSWATSAPTISLDAVRSRGTVPEPFPPFLSATIEAGEDWRNRLRYRIGRRHSQSVTDTASEKLKLLPSR